MAKEHHCPNCGAQPCNASTSKIHTCGVCAAVWEEVLSETPPAPKAAAAPPTAPPAVPATPAAPATGASPTAKPATPPAAPPTKPAAAVASPPSDPGTPSAPPAAASPSPPATPANPTAASPAPAPRGEDGPPPRGKRLSDVVAAAKAKRCPACESDSLAPASDYLEQGGRIVLVDSQTYRGHRWYADTGELLKEALLPATPAPPPAA